MSKEALESEEADGRVRDSRYTGNDSSGSLLWPSLDFTKALKEKEKDDVSIPSTQSQPDTDVLSEMPDLESQSPSEAEVHGDLEGFGLSEAPAHELLPGNSLHASMQEERQPEQQVDCMGLHGSVEGEVKRPTLPFHGFWQNSQEERIMIEGAELYFESGHVWTMKEQDSNGFTLELDGKRYNARCIAKGEQIRWNDGDTWVCIGRERPPFWCSDPSQLESMIAETFADVDAEPMSAAAAAGWQATGWPASSGSCCPKSEVCWEWKETGRCPRYDCDWAHPVCAPCGDGWGGQVFTWNADRF